MKKFFTLFAGLALAGSISANAEKVYLYVEDYDDNSLANYSESEISKDEQGNIILSDFMYSEAPFSFTFENPAVGKSADLVPTGYLDRSDASPYLLTPAGDYMTCWLWNYKESGDWTPIYYPYVYEQGYSYVYRYDMSDPKNTYEYYASICMNGFNEDNSKFGWIYINFWFNMPEASAVESIDAAADSPAVYFNLAGQRVENPSNGVFIRKQGANAAKVMLK